MTRKSKVRFNNVELNGKIHTKPFIYRRNSKLIRKKSLIYIQIIYSFSFLDSQYP